MNKLFSAVLSLVAVALTPCIAWAVEPTWNYAVQVSSAVQVSPPQISLSWPQDTTATPNSYTVYRKAPAATAWGGGTTLPGSATSYVDNGVAVGTAYEYAVVKNAGGYNGYGYIETGINVPLVENRGKVVLVVDNTYAAQLSAELNRLQHDLAGDGWTVLRHDVGRNDSVASVKNLIKADYNADAANVKAVFLFGHVPVPYSGLLNPDGHPEHYGAWPADVYYGDMDGNWTDNSVNYRQTANTDPADAARLTNVPGDGKFDQTTIPSAVELQVGGVDLANMPGRLVWGGSPTFPSEQELLRQYLNKDHNFRHKLMNVRRRGVVADCFGVRNGEAFAASAYRNFAPFFGASGLDNLNLMDNDAQGVWVPALKSNDYLWAHGSGAGSYNSVSGLGNAGNYNSTTTPEIVNNDIKAVFVTLFGSWLGDWDHEDDIMRGVLATPTYGLACAWSGRPHWFAHPMGLGETIGYTARLTQNNTGLYQNQINPSANLIHVALMGDPTLRLHPVTPPGTLGGTAGAGSATLTWTPSTDSVTGYYVYRATSANGPFTRLSGSLLNSTTFVDTSALSGATYMVRAVKLENTPSGSYYNASQGLFWTAGGAPPPAGDTIAPAVSVTAPANGATVSGSTVTVSANASDNVGVAGVQFKLDGANLGAEVTSAPYRIVWNPTLLASGAHILTAVARDAAGNRTTSAGINVTVPTSGSSTGTLPNWVGSTRHNWKPRLGGVYWLNSRAVVKQAAPYLTQHSRPVLVDIKSDCRGFGYRYDLNSWNSQEEVHSWFTWDGTDAGTPASPEDAFNIFGATGNAEFILNIPIPRSLTTNPTTDGFGYTWQTAEFYAAMTQYLFGTAGPQSEWQNLPVTLDFFSQPASFNWADLRARRGHVNPYPVVAVIIGEEPYNLEGCPDGASYGPQAEKFRVAIRNRGVNVPLGLHVRDMGIVDDSDPAKWFWPMMNNVTESDFSFIDLEHYYQFSTVSEDYKRTYPVSINPSGFQGWWLPKSAWKSDYTKNLWIVEDTRNALRDFGGAGVGDPNRWQLGFSEHGIQISSQFLYNDMLSAMHWATWLAEGMRQNITWDSGWTLLGEGFATADLQVRNGYVTRTPMFFVYQMAQEFYGYDYLDNSYSSAMGSTTDNLGRAVQFPWTTVRTMRDPATGNIHLFVVNQSLTDSATLSGFENWNVVSWKQIKGANFSVGDTVGVSGPEPIQMQAVTLPLAGVALAIAPVSVNHIVLAASSNAGNAVPISSR